jgi:hypothetical protein
LAEPGGGPWANCAWVEVSRGRFVGGRIVKAPHLVQLLFAHVLWVECPRNFYI